MSNIISIAFWKSPVGELVIGDIDGRLCLLDYRYRKMRKVVDSRIVTALQAEIKERKSDTQQKVIEQLNEYFCGERKTFDIELLTPGSEFQQKVWDALVKIPYGETSSYAQLADKIGAPNSVRAVASANGANAIAIIIPCHRVIGSNGDLTGYGGGLVVKKKLLDLESSRQQLQLF